MPAAVAQSLWLRSPFCRNNYRNLQAEVWHGFYNGHFALGNLLCRSGSAYAGRYTAS
jgi:hypothetical protein